MDQPWRYVLATFVTAGAVAIFTRLRGFSWLASILLLSLVGLIWVMNPSGSYISHIIQTLSLVYVGWLLWTNPEGPFWSEASARQNPSPAPQSEDEDVPTMSLVQLRSSRRYLEPTVLANALSEAWDLNITPDKDQADGSDGFVSGESPHYVVMLTTPTFAFFTLHNFDTPYFDDPEKMAANVKNLRFAEVIRNHSACLAMDFIRSSNPTLAEEQVYQWICKAAAALADDDTLALYSPEHQYFNLWSADLETTLNGASPLSAFSAEVKAAVIRVDDDSPMDQAIAEARSRWPEFVTAFHARPPDDSRFIVKAPFTSTDGEIEHMWMEVFGLEPDYVHGRLLNEPFHCRNLKKGSQVEVPAAEISDWICPDANDSPIGNFTSHVVNESAKV